MESQIDLKMVYILITFTALYLACKIPNKTLSLVAVNAVGLLSVGLLLW